MTKTIIIGNGFIAKHLQYEIVPWKLSPRDPLGFRDLIDAYEPDVIINCAGFTGSPNIDQCENDKIKTYTANVSMPLMLADECAHKGVHMIHLGSGCIFFGNSKSYCKGADPEDYGWKETDFANPQSYYSKCKYSTDLVLGQMNNVCILRLRMPVSHLNHPRNLLNKIISYNRVIDIPNSITFTSDLAAAIDFSITKQKTGIYHIASPKPLRHSDLLNEYGKYVEHYCQYITESELNKMVLAKRSNCILDVSKIQKEGFVFADTETQMRACIKEYIDNLRR